MGNQKSVVSTRPQAKKTWCLSDRVTRVNNMTTIDTKQKPVASITTDMDADSGDTATYDYDPAALRSLRRSSRMFDWLLHYRRKDLSGDLIAGIIVAIVLVPQSMAYALLAGLPPEIGLYASILPLVIYGLLGSSRVLAVGPVAIVSLLVSSTITPLAETGSTTYLQLAFTLALLVGIIRILMGLVHLGFLVNFLSHPVLSGFISAAAILIGFSQIRHLLGVTLPNTEHFHEQVWQVIQHLPQINPVTFSIGLTTIILLYTFNTRLGALLRRWQFPSALIMPVTRSAPLLVILLSTLVVWALALHEQAGVRIVGNVPAGLPGLTLPLLDMHVWRSLLPGALIISLVGYMESISVAKSLASKRRQKVRPNQELLALGAANLGAALTGGYPVDGGVSRSVVNFSAGANTGLASLITAILVALTVIFLTPLFYFLPQTVLAALIIVAVMSLIDVATLRHVWHYSHADGISLIITFFGVLAFGVDVGILVGVVIAIVLFLWRTSRPHVAIVGRLDDSETYRNIRRYEVKTCTHIVALRIDESLYFANTRFLEDTLLQIVTDQPQVRHLVLIGTGINFIDASALETLDALIVELRDAGVELYLAAFKGPVLDRLKAIGFIDRLGPQRVFISTHAAMQTLECV